MSYVESEFSGGESVYCINEVQMRKAVALATADPRSGPRIQELLREVESRLERNEQTALAFVLLDKLLKQPVAVAPGRQAPRETPAAS